MPPPVNERSFGEMLRELRCGAGLSQEELAERARVSPGAISTLERSARRAPQHQTLALLVEALRLPEAERARLEAAAAAGRRRGARSQPPTSRPPPHNVPDALTSFHGREGELGELRRLLRDRRLITLLGPGGVGKTRLALETARAEVEARAFPAGVWFVELAPLSDPALVVPALARLLDVRERPGAVLLDTLVAAIGAQPLLLLLDNCEHLIDECARVAERLARDCPGATILSTTREALRIDGECTVRVEPLAFVSAVVDGPALRLFVDRLSEADFTRFASLSAGERAHAVDICKRLDGIPLALELAAGRARELSLAQIAAGLDERFALLGRGRRTASPRQHTLRGMIDWSFVLLAPAEQRLFARLGLFADAFAPEAAASICGDDAAAVRDGLAALIAKSLVAVVEDRQGRLRYRLLETMRAYALERLAQSGDLAYYAERFARYFLSVARAADDAYGRVSNRDFVAAVAPDLDNLRAALDWALEKNQDPLLGAELAGALGWAYRQLSLVSEGVRWCEAALRANGALAGAVAGRLHMALSFFRFTSGDVQRALDAARVATAAYRAIEARSELSWSLTQEGYCLYLLGRSEESRAAVSEAVAVARAQADPFRLAGALNALALTVPPERAAERLAPLMEAVRCYRAAGVENVIVPVANLAEAHYACGDAAAALERGLEVVAITRREDDRANLAGALTNVAAYALALHDAERAGAAAGEALALVREAGRTLSAMCALQHLGSVRAQRGDHAGAARLLGASNRLYEEFGLAREFTERALYERTTALLARRLGDEPLLGHLAAGAALPLDAAIAEALADDGARGTAG